MGAHLFAGALRVRADGVKVPLGLVEGTTENRVVVTDLVTDLRDRGTALGAAVRWIFGGRALVQRCRRHKERNIVEHLPVAERPLVLRRLRAAPAEPDPKRAKEALLVTARGLAHQRPGVAASLREGFADTRTINLPSVTAKLRRAQVDPPGGVDDRGRARHATRVKHPESGEMALRWAAAEAQFRRVGFRELAALVAIAL